MYMNYFPADGNFDVWQKLNVFKFNLRNLPVYPGPGFACEFK